jgi:hypothetical protein
MTTKAAWLRLAGFASRVALLKLVGWGLFGTRAERRHWRALDARLHAWAATRVRRRPHRGDRQHDRKFLQGREARARRRLLLLLLLLHFLLLLTGVLRLFRETKRDRFDGQRLPDQGLMSRAVHGAAIDWRGPSSNSTSRRSPLNGARGGLGEGFVTSLALPVRR